jgi:hypothetical protein
MDFTGSNSNQQALLCCAHFGEAAALFRHDRWQKRSLGTFDCFERADGTRLLITGEVAAHAMHRISFALGRMHGDVDRLINFGVAASLDPTLKVGDTVSIRTAYGSSAPGQYEYRSFTGASAEASVDCISSAIRVLDNKHLPFYRAYARVLDRELWAIAFAAQSAGIPWDAFKAISDHIGSTDCQQIREHSEEWSQALAIAVEGALHSGRADSRRASTLDWEKELGSCYFTQSCQQQMIKWCRAIARQHNLTMEEAVAILKNRPEFPNALAQPSAKARGLAVVRLAEMVATHV